MALASLSDIDRQAFEALVDRAQVADTWVEKTLGWMRSNMKRNLVSRHWYSVFLSAAEPEVAWGAFQLFLARADRRFDAWRKSSEEGMPAGHERLRYVYSLKDDINRALEDSDRRLKVTFLGREICGNQLAPFQ